MKLKLSDNNADKPKGLDNIMFGHLGNGITVWDKNRRTTNNFDYMIIAQIDANRHVQYKVEDIEDEAKQYIDQYAKSSNPTVSATSGINVFNVKAELANHYFTFGIGQLHENNYVIIPSYTQAEARETMTKLYGLTWAFQYTEEKWNIGDGTTLADKYKWIELVV